MSQYAKKPVLEKDIEDEGNKLAEAWGWFHEKVISRTRRGFPDDYYVRDGRTVLVEWKKPGGRLSANQIKRHKDLRAHGAEVHVFNNLEDFTKVMR